MLKSVRQQSRTFHQLTAPVLGVFVSSFLWPIYFLVQAESDQLLHTIYSYSSDPEGLLSKFPQVISSVWLSTLLHLPERTRAVLLLLTHYCNMLVIHSQTVAYEQLEVCEVHADGLWSADESHGAGSFSSC